MKTNCNPNAMLFALLIIIVEIILRTNADVVPFVNGSCSTWTYSTDPDELVTNSGERFIYNWFGLLNDSLIIEDNLHGRLMYMADRENQRLVRYSYKCQSLLPWDMPQINISALFIRFDFLYLFDATNYRVEKWLIMNSTLVNRSIVAGNNGFGSNLNQIASCNGGGLYVDLEESIYVSDTINHRVTRWNSKTGDAKLLAGGQGNGTNLTQLASPAGIYVDVERGNKSDGSLYIADYGNNRIMRWKPNASEGELVFNNIRIDMNQTMSLQYPTAIIGDRSGYIYISSYRFVSKYLIDSDFGQSSERISDRMSVYSIRILRNLRFDYEGNIYTYGTSYGYLELLRYNINQSKCLFDGQSNHSQTRSQIIDYVPQKKTVEMNMTDSSTTLCTESLWDTEKPIFYPPKGEVSDLYITFNDMAYDENNETWYITISFGGILKWSPKSCSATLFRHYDNERFTANAIFRKDNKLYFYNEKTGYIQKWTMGTSFRHRENIYGPTHVNSIVVDQSEKYIYVSLSGTHQVIRLSANGQEAPVIIAGNENGQSGSLLSELYYPLGLYLDERNEDLYIADSWNGRIVCYSLRNSEQPGRIVAGGNGLGMFLNQLREPQSLVVDEEGTMYIAAYGRIIRWMKGAKQGQILMGDNSFVGYPPSSNISSTYISYPHGIGFDSKNNLYFVDTLARRIVKLNLDNKICTSNINNTIFTTTAAPNVTVSQQNSTTSAGPKCWTTNAVFTTVAQHDDVDFGSIYDLAVDERNGIFYLADSYRQHILEIHSSDLSSTTSKPLLFTISLSPTALYLSRNGWLFVADRKTNEIKKYLIGGPKYTLQTMAGGNGDGIDPSQIANCYGLAMVEEAGHIYISDLNNHRVTRWSLKTLGEVAIVAGNSSSGSGLNQLSFPRGIHIIGNHLFIADTGNNRIVRVDLNNTQNDDSDGHSQSKISVYQYNFKRPTSITSDSQGKIFYIADQSRILKWWFDRNWIEILADATGANLSYEIYGLRLSQDERHLYAVDKLNYRLLKLNTMITKCDSGFSTHNFAIARIFSPSYGYLLSIFILLMLTHIER